MPAVPKPLLLAACLFAAGCDVFGTSDGEIDYGHVHDISYRAHVQPLLDRRCGSCHGGADAAAGLRLDTWDHLIAGSRFGEAVIPFDPARSLLVELATKRVGGAHPKELGADTLSRAEVDFLARWIDEGAPNDDGAVPYEDAARLLYVCSQDAALVSVVDLDAHVVIRSVDLTEHGFSANAKPHHVAVEPDGSAWYVSLIGDSKIAKFDRQNRLVGVATTPTPGLLAVHPTRDLLMAGRSMTAVNPPATLAFLSRAALATRPVEEVPVVFPRPHALVVSPDGRYVYTASVAENELITVDVESQEATFTPLARGMAESFVQFALSLDGRQLYLSGEMTGLLHVFDLADPAQPVWRKAIPVGARPWDPVSTPDGRSVYVGNKGANTVTVVDAATQAVAAVIQGDGLAEPHGAAVRSDGRYVYVSNNNLRGTYVPRHDLGDNTGSHGEDPDHHKTAAAGAIGTVVVIDTATRQVVKVLEVEANATGLGIAE